ncbi:MAG: hypothetical protein KIT84_16710 [Labilithrix sp.]|nr:hypothetical protein [Labilithrix sp.]MCW5812673.1 hypothetical protein [Labilithrix sp.]
MSRDESALAPNSKGLLAWLRRLVAGSELDALRARLADAEAASAAAAEARAGEADTRARQLRALEERLAGVAAERDAARRELAAQAPAPIIDEEALLAPLRLELEQRVREQTRLEQTIARKEAERRDAAARLATAQQEHGAHEKKLRSTESLLRDTQREVLELRNGIARLEARVRELTESRDATIDALERRLVDALAASPLDAASLERALRDRDALVEELTLALESKRREA